MIPQQINGADYGKQLPIHAILRVHVLFFRYEILKYFCGRNRRLEKSKHYTYAVQIHRTTIKQLNRVRTFVKG